MEDIEAVVKLMGPSEIPISYVSGALHQELCKATLLVTSNRNLAYIW
jgi:hypothetical protein